MRSREAARPNWTTDLLVGDFARLFQLLGSEASLTALKDALASAEELRPVVVGLLGLLREQRMARPAGTRLLVPEFKFHWLRHTAISLAARAGMAPELVARRVGQVDGGGR